MARSRLRAAREFFSLVAPDRPQRVRQGLRADVVLPDPARPRRTSSRRTSTRLDPDDSPLARLPQLHMSRLHVIRGLVYQGPPQVPETLDHDYLIFTASIDGDIDAFLRDVASRLGPDADAIFSHTVGFPGIGRLRRVRALGARAQAQQRLPRLAVAVRDRAPDPRGAARPGGLRRARRARRASWTTPSSRPSSAR